jgi:hypothetical protein
MCHITTSTPTVLALGGTGTTGLRLVAKLAELGLSVRTAARHGADVRFDWNDSTTHRPALEGVDRYLSAYGMDQASPEVGPRAVDQPIKHADIDRQAWIQARIAAGLPADYSGMLALLTETIASGHGSQPNDDVAQATGRPPTTFTDYVRRTAGRWVGAHQWTHGRHCLPSNSLRRVSNG